jgi:hypothetical protein
VTVPSLTQTSPKTPPLNIFKALPALPNSNDNENTFQKDSNTIPGINQKFGNVAVVKGVPFDYMFADADESDVNTIRDDDQDSLGKFI